MSTEPEYVDGVKRPKYNHFVRGNKIWDWIASCPECGSEDSFRRWDKEEPSLDHNQPPEQYYGVRVECLNCREIVTLKKDDFDIRDLMPDLRGYQEYENSVPDWKAKYEGTKKILSHVLEETDHLFQYMPCRVARPYEGTIECDVNNPCDCCETRKKWHQFRKLVSGFQDMVEGKLGPGPYLTDEDFNPSEE